ncbi:MAG: SDR family oxidoreductase [Pseudomonadota bacterium]
MRKALFLGLGYSARPLAERLHQEGWAVSGTTRSEAKAETLKETGVEPVVWTAENPLPQSVADDIACLIISIGPNGEHCPAAAALQSMRLPAGLQILYLSSAGVYGDYGGAWIDEESPCRPGTERGRSRLAAENAWHELAQKSGASLTLCRLAGIYGPERNAVQSLRGDTPGARAGLSRRLIKPGQVFNRIHRDDIAAGLWSLLTMEAAPSIVNFADDHPSPPAEPITYAAEILGIDPPPEVRYEDIENELSPMARSFYAENKRMRNARLKALPQFTLLYPSYREGLAAIHAALPR